MDAEALAQIATTEQARVLVLPTHRLKIEEEALAKLLNRLESSLALTREGE